MRVRAAGIVAVMGWVVACTTPDAPAGPKAVVSPVAPVMSVAVPTGGLTGFRFEPPMVRGPSPKGPGTFDATLLDLLSVEICQWSGTACVGAPVRRITSADGPPAGLTVNKNAEVYRALWNSALDVLDPTKDYRIRVLGSGTEIGYANIDVVSPSSSNVTQPGWMRVVQGSTVPIVFRIETGLGSRVTPSGGTVTLANGAVTLTLPPGAVPNDVLFTVQPATGFPTTPPTVPGTELEFGPNGIVFAKPVTMTIKYDPSKIPSGMVENKLRIHKLINGVWVQQNAGQIDLVNKTVSAQVNGFSTYALLVQLAGGTQADLLPPDVLSFTFFDAASGTFKPTITIDASSADVPVRMRMAMTDNGAGVDYLYLVLRSPTGSQVRLQCYYFSTTAPISGSDTNGEWECSNTWPQYSEAGVYTLWYLQLWDKARNFAFFYASTLTPTTICDTYRPTSCLPSIPQVTVVSSPSDVTAPSVLSFQVSADVQPRSFGSSVSVDVGASGKVIIFGVQMTDNLSGVGAPQNQYTGLVVHVPGGFNYGVICHLAQGTNLAGFWECPWYIPQNSGAMSVVALYPSDRAGNGSGYALGGTYSQQPNGLLCNSANQCLAPPTVQVTSTGDVEAPLLQSVNLSVGSSTSTGTPVTGTVNVSDNLTGATNVLISFTSKTSNQSQYCWASRTTGTATNGTWSCTINFSTFAARGQWDLNVSLYDAALNYRNYLRRATDGFMCYFDNASQQVCTDFGTTTLTLQ